MVWSGVWEHLSSWLSPNLTCITSVIRSELNEKYYFASDICTKSRSVNRSCFSFTLPSSQFLFFLLFLPFLHSSSLLSSLLIHMPFFLLFFVPVNQSIPFPRPISPFFNLSYPPLASRSHSGPPRRSWTAVRLRWCYNISAPSLSTSWPCLPCMQTKRAKL